MAKYFEDNKAAFDKLDQYLPIVERVHGPHHEEIYAVGDTYRDIRSKVKGGTEDLSGQFEEIRKITNNYAVPNDVCESYEAVYETLEQLDKANSAR